MLGNLKLSITDWPTGITVTASKKENQSHRIGKADGADCGRKHEWSLKANLEFLLFAPKVLFRIGPHRDFHPNPSHPHIETDIQVI